MKKRSINGNHINMIKGRLEGESIDSDAPPHTSNILMNRAAKTEAGPRGSREERGGGVRETHLRGGTGGRADPIRREPGREG